MKIGNYPIASSRVVLLIDVCIGQLSLICAAVVVYRLLDINAIKISRIVLLLLFAALVQFAVWITSHMHHRIARFSGFNDYMHLIQNTFLTNFFNLVVAATLLSDIKQPFLLFLLSFIFTSFCLLAIRIFVRALIISTLSTKSNIQKKKLLIYGAGELGMTLKHALDSNKNEEYQLVGFLDDDEKKIGMIIKGVEIYSPSQNLHQLIAHKKIDEIIIATKSMSSHTKSAFIEDMMQYKIKIRELPSIEKWFANNFNLNQLESIKINDLLGREPINLLNQEVQKMCEEKVIMITGAAGSIGSELVRKISQRKPSLIVCVDQAETPMHALMLEMEEDGLTETKLIYLIADIRDKERIEHIFEMYQPEIVFHAAAYKHVPMMEDNPYEAITTNILGTKILAEAARDHGAEKFVMISTDKAVNPTSIMGVTKRIAEAFVQALNKASATTSFITTRFGNVLGSNGSVVPIFKRQIAAGGPVTVTHPDMVRYFMTIPEACELVLEAGTMGKGGEVFVFEMGKPVKIYDLAKNMIRLAGLVPDQDIKISFTGTRPGEKLYEELFVDEDLMLPTHHPKIKIGKVKQYEMNYLLNRIHSLLNIATVDDINLIKETFKSIVPEFTYKTTAKVVSTAKVAV
jgi:FlaA1/EpsC-like NDP-sugar epimerase